MTKQKRADIITKLTRGGRANLENDIVKRRRKSAKKSEGPECLLWRANGLVGEIDAKAYRRTSEGLEAVFVGGEWP